MYSEILFEVQDPVATITLNRPERLNALTGRMLQELEQALAQAEASSDVVGIVLTGAGRGFCSGVDMGELERIQQAGDASVMRAGKGELPQPGARGLGPDFGAGLTYLLTLRKPLLAAVKAGVGLGGWHGGMCDAFRQATDYQFMTGGQWVAHPGDDGTRYAVHITDPHHPVTRDIGDFDFSSAQYYMHVDPAVKVLAATRFLVADGPHVPNGPVEMPVIWTKFFGRGRVCYNAIGHTAAVPQSEPVPTLLRRGLAWAAERA